MAGSSYSGGSFTALSSDLNQGSRAFVARLDATTNPSGLITPGAPGVYYTGATVFNESPDQHIRAQIAYSPAAFIAPGDDVQLVPPRGSVSFSFDGDVIEAVRVQAVTLNPIGTVADASTLPPGIAAPITVTVNFVNA